MFWWTAHLRAGPEVHRAVAVGDRLYSFGVPCVSNVLDSAPSDDPSAQIEVHVLDTASLRWTAVPPVSTRQGDRRPLEVPPDRTGYTASLVDDVVYVWGGYHPACTAARAVVNPKLWTVLFAFDTDTHRWFRPGVTGSVPEARRQHSACVFGTSVYIHGGFNKLRYLNSVHRLDVSAMLWSLIDTSGGLGGASAVTPPASTGHSATAVGATMLVFGGRGDHDEDAYRRVRAFDTRTQRWARPSPPGSAAAAHPEGCSSNNNHSAFALPDRPLLYVFGGSSSGDCALWSFDPDGGAWRKVATRGVGTAAAAATTPAAPRRPSYGMRCCVMGDGRVAFGGCSEVFVLDPRPSLATLCRMALAAPRGPTGQQRAPSGAAAMMSSPDARRRELAGGVMTASDKKHKQHNISLVLPRERPREAQLN